jgi:hypothetical protein
MRTIFHYKSPHISAIDGKVCSDKPLPAGQTVVHTSGLGDLSAKPIPWPVGDFTGFYPKGRVQDFQRGLSEEFYGSSAVQLQGTIAAMQIHTYSWPIYEKYRLALLYYGWQEQVFPWRYGPSAKLCIDHHAVVPSSWTGDGSLNYAYTAIGVNDTATGKSLWIAMLVYDCRGPIMFAETGVWWPEASIAIALGFYGGKRYSSLLPKSSWTASETWKEWRYFGFSISREQLQTMIVEVNDKYSEKYSTNPDDYQLALFDVGPEMTTPQASNGHMAMKIKDVRVFTRVD